MSQIYSNHGTFVMFKSKLNILWFLPWCNVHGGSPKVVVGTWILNSNKINHRITILIVLWKYKIVLKNKRYQNMEIKQTENLFPEIWDLKKNENFKSHPFVKEI